MHKDIIKFENPERINELNPIKTLSLIGINSKSIVCDYGAGTGIFTLPAAEITTKVYAVDINPERIDIIEKKLKTNNITNVETILVKDKLVGIKKESVDNVVLVTVFHEIEDRVMFFSDINNILKKDGTIGIVEFHKRETLMGPPITSRVGKKEVIKSFKKEKFILDQDVNLGNNFYLLVFKNNKC